MKSDHIAAAIRVVGHPDQITPLSLGLADESSVFFGFDLAKPGSDRTVVWPPLPESVTVTVTEDIAGDMKRFFDDIFEKHAKDEAFDPWADTRRLNELGRAPDMERDAAEVMCRHATRGTPIVVTKAQARDLEAIEFDQALYTATDTPFGALQVVGRSNYRDTDTSWMRSLEDYNEEQARELAVSLDPYHPSRRSKGEKRRNRSKRK